MTSIKTPPFVAWSLDYRCRFKEFCRDSSPLEIEKSLRPLTEYGRAAREERIFGDTSLRLHRHLPCGDREDSSSLPELVGFPVVETLASFGTPEEVRSTCDDCRANVARGGEFKEGSATHPCPSPTANCYGQLPFSDEQLELGYLYHQLHRDKEIQAVHQLHFSPQPTPWLGLWQSEVLDGEAIPCLLQVLSPLLREVAEREHDCDPNNRTLHIPNETPRLSESLLHLLAALRTAEQEQLPVRFQRFPEAAYDGRRWRFAAHCPNCYGTMHDSARYCAVCRRSGGPQPARTRKARGLRPYMPLTRFLGSDQSHCLQLEWKSRFE